MRRVRRPAWIIAAGLLVVAASACQFIGATSHHGAGSLALATEAPPIIVGHVVIFADPSSAGARVGASWKCDGTRYPVGLAELQVPDEAPFALAAIPVPAPVSAIGVMQLRVRCSISIARPFELDAPESGTLAYNSTTQWGVTFLL